MAQVNPGPFLEVYKMYTKETTENTYVEDAYPMPVSENENLAMLIHKIMMRPGEPDLIASTKTENDVQLTSQSNPAPVAWHDESVIMRRDVSYNFLGVITTAPVEWETSPMPHIEYYDPPLLYARRNMYLGVLGKNNGVGVVMNCYVYVYYTVEKVSKEAFIAALVH